MGYQAQRAAFGPPFWLPNSRKWAMFCQEVSLPGGIVMSILSNRPLVARVDGSGPRRRPCNQRLAPKLGLGAVALLALMPTCLAIRAKADPIDLTTLPPFYVLGPTDFVPGPFPGFSETATANLLTVTGKKISPRF